MREESIHINRQRNKTPFKENLTFPERVLKLAKSQPTTLAIADSSGIRLPTAELVIRSHILAREVDLRTNELESIGILLPTSTSAAVAALAVLIAEKIPVFLNYTSSQDSINYALNKSQIRFIISSQQFVTTIKFTPKAKVLFIEDIFHAESIENIWDSELNSIIDSELPDQHGSFAERESPLQRTATIVFSSGSTGTPKGVVLSHHNLNSNAYSVLQALKVSEGDVIMGSLPFFHSFGFLATFWLPLYHNIPVVYHANPMEAAKVGELIQAYKCTIIFATPTFLQAYIRKCLPEQLKSLRLVITGAEKLSPKTADLFFQKFGIMPVEGYGCTELSPVVSINFPSDEKEIGTNCGKPGSVGKALPDVEVKIIDPETKEPLKSGQEGLLLVKGPNVMQGYLGEPEKTKEVLQGGWYNTGDMGWVDNEGYIHITGRYSRFSKIAGEMVPHGGIEEEIHKILGISETKVIVTGVADPRKGERLIVLYLPLKMTPNEIIDRLRQSGFANLWIPKLRDFYPIEEIPLLGSGKLDLKRIGELASQLTT